MCTNNPCNAEAQDSENSENLSLRAMSFVFCTRLCPVSHIVEKMAL